MEETTTKTCTKKRVLSGARAEIEPGHTPYWARRSTEEYAKFLEDWAKGIHEFFRDHRHQDVNAITVIRDTEDQCSECGCAWETFVDEEDGKTKCAGCGGVIQ